MAALLIGYARCSTDQQDLTAQRDGLIGLGVPVNRIAPTGSARGCEKHSRRAGTATPWWGRCCIEAKGVQAAHQNGEPSP